MSADLDIDRSASSAREASLAKRAAALLLLTAVIGAGSCVTARADDGDAARALIQKHRLEHLAGDVTGALSHEEVRPVVEKVRGYLTFHGFKVGPVNPDVLIVELHDGNQAEVAYGLVLIGARQPEGCRGRLLAHEATHFFLSRDYGRSSKDEDVEALANDMERLVVPDYLPNCGD